MFRSTTKLQNYQPLYIICVDSWDQQMSRRSFFVCCRQMSATLALLLVVCVGFLIWAAVTTGLYVRCKQAAVVPAPSVRAAPLYQAALNYLKTPTNTTQLAFSTLMQADPDVASVTSLLKTKTPAEVMPLIGTTMIKLYGYVYGPAIITALGIQVINETTRVQGVMVTGPTTTA